MYNALIIWVTALAGICESYKILLVFPFPFKSHSILGESVVNLLLEAGHEVSYITPDPIALSHPNLNQIVIKPYNFIGYVNLKTLDVAMKLKDIFDEMLNVTYSAITDTNVQNLIEDPAQTFDLVIVEWMHNDLYSGFSTVFNCPYIWFFTMHIDHDILRLIDDSPHPSLTTNIRTKNIPPLNFPQRVQELLYVMYSKSQAHLYNYRRESEIYGKLFQPVLAKRGRSLPPYEMVRYNASLAFVNSHFSIRDSPILPQSYKFIGGFHVSDKTKPLNQELRHIMESSKDGVVLFSLGSFLKAEDLPRSVKSDLLMMFSKLNQTVLWKIDEHLKDLPSNVRTSPWIPLQRVLAHPNCLLFITHGGILSLIESVHYGVPIVGVPVFADQEVNIRTAVNRGVGKMVHMGPKLADGLKEAIMDVLSDSRYKENMKTLSSLYHDRPLSPDSELLRWVDHVVATRGAPHLRSPVFVPWYQKYYLDLAAVLLVLLIFSIFLVNKLFQKVIITFDDIVKINKSL